MIDFKIDPPSGFAEAYWDVRFSLSYNKSEKAIINLFNKTTKEPSQNLGVSNGYIAEETSAITKNNDSIEGYFNVFNKDKMNKKLSDFTYVEIACEVELQNNGDINKEVSSLNFYNESKSLDGAILPFDLIVENNELDMSQNVPLHIHIVNDREKSYELSIRSHNDNQTCSFEIFTKKGRTDLFIPVEFLVHELEIDKTFVNKFDIYCTKFEGIDYSGFMNRKRVRIPNTQIRFLQGSLMPQKQSRLDPIGRKLSQDFVLSDRYFVHTHKEFSGLAAFTQLPEKRMSLFARFIHEAQHMQVEDATKKVEKKSDTEITKSDIAKATRQEAIKSNMLRSTTDIPQHRELLTSLSSVYAAKSSQSRPNYRGTKAPTVETFSNAPAKKGGCGCSRNKNK